MREVRFPTIVSIRSHATAIRAAVDHDKILENLVALEARVSATQERIAQFRDVVANKEAAGENAVFARTMLQECEAVLAIHLEMHERLLRLLGKE